MNKVVIKLVDELKIRNMISSEKEDNYIYAVEMFIMKIIGFILIIKTTRESNYENR